MKLTPVFTKNLKAVTSKKRFIINQGGTSSSKTYSILQLLIIICLKRKNLIISIVAETYPHLKRGAMRDFYQILMAEGLYHPAHHNKTDGSYRIGSNLIEFFSGDKVERMKGARRDILFVNEAYGIKYEVFDQLEVRTKWFCIIDFNPVSQFWVHDEVIKNSKPECDIILSTYIDNPYLNTRIIESIERHRHNEYWWRVYGLGMIGQIEGLIFSNHRYLAPGEEWPTYLPYGFGLDFGFNAPDAMVKTVIDTKNKKMYWDEKIYKEGNTPAQLKELIGLHCNRNDQIIADCADARMIADLKSLFNIKGVDKKKWTVSEGIRMMQDYEHIMTEDSLNLSKEFNNYVWSDKKAGIPIDDFDHLIDGGRYRFMETTARPVSHQTWRG
jgi:phage terminase large subunit